MAKRKAQNSTTEDENEDDAHKRPKIKRTRNAKNNESSENQMEVSISLEDSHFTRVNGDGDDDSENRHCSQMPDFDVQNEAEVGIIEKVVLQNFMCHKYLDVNFGPNVNFIIGKNGSGKSAIMTGLIVGLGGKASTTSRGSSLKGFIKDECHSAVVTVKLRNRGIDAYTPDEYGNSISIERRITQDGSGSYKLKSQDGRVISTKKEDLIMILDQFNIQIDNPVSILNQDTSRCFLNSSDPKDKYKFFLKATQLEQMSNHYQLILEQKQNIKDILDKKKEILPDMESQVKDLEDKYKDIAQLKEIREKVKKLKEECVWAHVRDKRNEVEEAKRKVERQEARLSKNDEKIKEQKDVLDNLQKQHSDKDSEIRQYVNSANEFTDSKRESNRVLKKMKGDFRFAQERVRKKDRELAISKKEKCQLADRIAELKQTAIRSHESERQAKQEALDEKKGNRQQLEAQLQTSIHMRNQLETSIKKSQEQEYKLRQRETEIRRRHERTEMRIQQLQQSQKNKLNIFGSWAPNVVNKIKALEKEGKFHRTPVGPLGAHISLRDQKWNVAVEKCLGNQLMLAFCCHDLHDKTLLMRILKQYCKDQEPPVIISKHQDSIYDVSQNRSRSQHPAVLDMLDIPNPVVANALIDQGRIESVLLIEKPADAKNEIWNVKPSGASKAFTIRGDEVIGGRTQKYYSNKYMRAKYLSSSVQHEIKQCQEELVTIDNDRLQLRERKGEIGRQIRDAQTELQTVKQKCSREQGQINRLNLEIQDLESLEEEASPDLTALEEDLEQYEMKIEELQTEISADNETLSLQKEALARHQENDREITEKLEELAQLIEPLTEELDRLVQEIAQAKSDRKHYENREAKIKGEIETVAKSASDLEEDLKTMIEEATSYSEEIISTRTVISLESEISKIESRVRREEKSRGNAEDITRRYHEAMSKYKEVCDRFKSFRKFHKLLDKVIMKRAEQFDNFRRYIVSRAKQYFTMTLSQRGYSGKLKIDHEEETLSIQVNVQQSKGTATKDTKSLSGGERSFSTICFIMALWEAMESPFRVLDEFDVFMDMVNRRISMNMLLKIADEQSNRQFVLLTPQDMSNVAAGNKVRIYKMRDPERGQTMLPFRPVSQS